MAAAFCQAQPDWLWLGSGVLCATTSGKLCRLQVTWQLVTHSKDKDLAHRGRSRARTTATPSCLLTQPHTQRADHQSACLSLDAGAHRLVLRQRRTMAASSWLLTNRLGWPRCLCAASTRAAGSLLPGPGLCPPRHCWVRVPTPGSCHPTRQPVLTHAPSTQGATAW